MFRKVVNCVASPTFVVGLVVGWQGTELLRLRRNYPWKDGLSPDTNGALPDGAVDPGHVSVVVQSPPRASRFEPLNTYLTAFYSCWTLQLEGWLARKFNFVSVPPAHVPRTQERFADGLFQGVFRDDRDSTLMVAWAAGKPNPSNPPAGGVQVFTARIDDITGDLEISFGGAEWAPPYGPPIGAVATALHHMYCRYLLDQAKKKLEERARRDW